MRNAAENPDTAAGRAPLYRFGDENAAGLPPRHGCVKVAIGRAVPTAPGAMR